MSLWLCVSLYASSGILIPAENEHNVVPVLHLFHILVHTDWQNLFAFLQNITCNVEEIDASYLNTAMVSTAFLLLVRPLPLPTSACRCPQQRRSCDHGPHSPIVSAGPAGEE